MSHRSTLMLVVTGVAVFGGCHTGPRMASFIENRNAEARQLEDEYWRQVQENERLVYELEKLKRQRKGGDAQPGILGPQDSREEMPGGLQPPMVEEGTKPPEVEIPGTPPAGQPGEMRPRSAPRIEAEPPPRPDGGLEGNPPGAQPFELPPPRGAAPAKPGEYEVSDQKVTHLFLNPLHTGGIDLDRRPGDDGLSLLLEPRNAAEQFVPLAGNVSVVLLDPNKSGDAARIARWNFGSQETEPAISASGEARGIHLEMPWPSRPPESSQLRLFVRYETADGRKIQTERDVFITLAGQFSERWTPRPPERQRRNPPVQPAIVRQREPVGSSAATEQAAKEPAPTIAAQTGPNSPAAAQSSPPLLAPPPALSDAPGAAPSRPTWKPYR